MHLDLGIFLKCLGINIIRTRWMKLLIQRCLFFRFLKNY